MGRYDDDFDGCCLAQIFYSIVGITYLLAIYDWRRIKKIIVDRGYKLADLAKDLGISPQALNRRLSVKYVKIDFVKDIEAALKISLLNNTQSDVPNDTMSALLKLLQKKDEQIDRLIELLEKDRDGKPSVKKENVG